MELRHLRYFVAVAEEGNFTHAAERRLHTSQPSLSRQIRDLEAEVGVALMTRDSRGMELTEAGRVFLDHARLALSQVETATAAARRVAGGAKSTFVLGFLTGYEMEWLPKFFEIFQDELHKIELIIHSRSSPDLAQALLRGEIDLALLRPDRNHADITFRVLRSEPLVAILPRRHRLAQRTSISLSDLADETFVSIAKPAGPTLRAVVDDYILRSGSSITYGPEAETLPMVISLVLSTSGLSILPQYAERLLPPSVVSRSLRGSPPMIDLALGYNSLKTSPLRTHLLSKVDSLFAAAEQQSPRRPSSASSMSD